LKGKSLKLTLRKAINCRFKLFSPLNTGLSLAARAHIGTGFCYLVPT
jgi:hypothetical protein